MNLFAAIGKGDVKDDARVQYEHLANTASGRKPSGLFAGSGGAFPADGAGVVGVSGALIDLIADEGEAEYDEDADDGEDALNDAHDTFDPSADRGPRSVRVPSDFPHRSSALEAADLRCVSRMPQSAAAETLDFDNDLQEEEVGADAVASTSRHTVEVSAEAAGQRLDKVLTEALTKTGLSRSRLKSLIEQGLVATGGRTIDDASYRVKPGELLTVIVPGAEPAQPVAQEIPLTILYEDSDLLVLDKPAGMVVHPAAGNPDGTLVNALLSHCGNALSGIGGVRRPGIVHRLDKDTSGLMVVAKTDRAHQGLSAQFSDRTLSRTYQAVVWGRPLAREGEVDLPIGRHPLDRKRMAVVKGPTGKPAVTRYRVLRGLGPAVSLIECKLMTGRTHQIRVHMAHIGHPLVGDPLYGRGRIQKSRHLRQDLRSVLTEFPRQALHAVALEFQHPATAERMRFQSSFPSDIESLIDRLESI